MASKKIEDFRAADKALNTCLKVSFTSTKKYTYDQEVLAYGDVIYCLDRIGLKELAKRIEKAYASSSRGGDPGDLYEALMRARFEVRQKAPLGF